MKKKLLLGLFVSTAALGLAECNKEEKKEEPKQDQKQEQKVEEKKLTCSLKDDTDTMKYTFTFSDENSTFTKATLTVTSKYESEKAANKQYENAKKDIENYNKAKGISANTQSSGTTVTNSVTFTVKDLDDKGKTYYEEAGLKELDGKNSNDIKSALEKNAWSCN